MDTRSRLLSKFVPSVNNNGDITADGISPNVSLGGGDAITVYSTRNALPMSGNEDGNQAFVIENSRLYMWNTSGWYSVVLEL